jgi:NTE family protein
MRDRGDVPFAIRASCTIPGWYVPVSDEQGRQLVDGGLVAVIPSLAARALGADLVIAVDVNADGASFFGASTRSIVGVLLQSMLVFQRTASHPQVESADLVIRPKVGHIRWDQVRRADELIRAGYQAGLESIPHIQGLIDESMKAVRSSTFRLPLRKEQAKA